MTIPRGLSAEEEAAWARLAESVTPLPGRKRPDPSPQMRQEGAKPVARKRPAKSAIDPLLRDAKGVGARRSKPSPIKPSHTPPRGGGELDSHWNRKLKAGQITPDYTLDLHGHTLDSAYHRVVSGLDQARAMDARVVLVIAGRERPVDAADRATRRGAIRAKLLDWLAASHHADSISAVRRAHVRHGGEGALYLVLKRRR